MDNINELYKQLELLEKEYDHKVSRPNLYDDFEIYDLYNVIENIKRQIESEENDDLLW